MHYADRNCGWCDDDNMLGCMNVSNSTCNKSKFYVSDNAVCHRRVLPSGTPWPRYEADASFCYNMAHTWCEKCVTELPDSKQNMSCVWCYSSKECVMGDAARGPLFLPCAEWAFYADDKCVGKASKTTILVVRIVLPTIIAAAIILGVIGCYKVIKASPAMVEYEEIK
jgi:hypothetical protein